MLKQTSLVLLVFLSCVGMSWLAGCGGGGGPQFPGGGSGAGREVIEIQWPQGSPSNRLIPAATQSVKIQVSSGGQVIATQTVDKPTQGSFSTTTFNNIPAGTVTNTATGYPQAEAVGTPLAVGSQMVNLAGGQTANITINLVSTINSITITPVNPSVAAGATTTLTANAADASGNMVLLTAGKLSWASGNTAIATVDQSGVVTGVAIGTAQITAADTESGKNVSTTITVTTAAQVTPLSLNQTVATAFQQQMIVGSNNGLASSRLLMLNNVPGPGSKSYNVIFWGSRDANGVPNALAEAAVWQNDLTKAEYIFFDAQGQLARVVDSATNTSILLSYPAPNQVMLTFEDPTGNITGSAIATVDLTKGTTSYQVTMGAGGQGATRASAHPSRQSIDPDDNPPDDDGDEAVPDISCPAGRQGCTPGAIVRQDLFGIGSIANPNLTNWRNTLAALSGAIFLTNNGYLWYYAGAELSPALLTLMATTGAAIPVLLVGAGIVAGTMIYSDISQQCTRQSGGTCGDDPELGQPGDFGTDDLSSDDSGAGMPAFEPTGTP